MRPLSLDLVFFILAFFMQIKDSTTRSKILRSPDASTHLYQRVRPSIRQPTCTSVDPSICSKCFICKSAFFYFWDWEGRQGSRRGWGGEGGRGGDKGRVSHLTFGVTKLSFREISVFTQWQYLVFVNCHGISEKGFLIEMLLNKNLLRGLSR